MSRQRLRPIMLGGTGSDVGKSLLSAGLCRIFLQDGFHPAPFKAQNMALNSYVTTDGLEIGRAQAVQAEAAGIECSSDMNPILLKPIGDCTSQVILNGMPIGNRSARDYFNNAARAQLADEAHKAFDRLATKYNPVVIEGAGSIAEINLMHLDIVNMPMARYADASVILVADISRGGVFANVYGSIMLQNPDDKRRIQGIIINKFRGDIKLFADGVKQLEDLCGIPVLGVMPYLPDLHIEEEDSYFSKKQQVNSYSNGQIKVGVVKLDHISNFTDFDPLEIDPRVDLCYSNDPQQIRECDIIILPGSKATLSDLNVLYENGMAQCVKEAYKNGKTVIGICGGYQMMGEIIKDPNGEEGNVHVIKGLGLLPTETTISHQKTTRRVKFKLWGSNHICNGYEIHMGKTIITQAAMPFSVMEDGTTDGCRLSDKCFGTYMHGLFENKAVVDDLLAAWNSEKSSSIDYKTYKGNQYNRLAEEMRKHLDIELIYTIMSHND